MLVRSISSDLLANIFVENNKPFVRHSFDAHDQLPQLTSPRRLEFAGEPAHRICLQRVHREGNLLAAMASAALECALLKSPFAGRTSNQSHPVFAGWTHRPLDDGITHGPH
jgi:hypothetical protein